MNAILFIFLFLIILTAVSYGHRTLIGLVACHSIEKQQLPKIGTAILALICFVTLAFVRFPIVVWFILSTVMILLGQIHLVFKNWRERRFYQSFSVFLEHLIMHMSVGFSFIESARRAADSQPKVTAFQWHQLIDRIVYVPRPTVGSQTGKLADIESLFRFVEKNSHQSLQILREVREQTHVIERFRHKSRQLTRQTKMQALIMSILYLVMLLLMISIFGIQSNMTAFGISFVLFCIGFCWLFSIGRRIKWKI